ncbi:MAG TPA: pyrroline-5-carboxylate reductase [Spirochaetia bacterium]|nr:pyrroline-5-carboxylate reductase [Spirochaetia bacterium]
MNLGIIGFGIMGRAIADGLRRSETSAQLFVYDKSESQTMEAQTRYGAFVCRTPAELCAKSELLLVAVKPQNTEELFVEFRELCSRMPVISIVAGRTISYFRSGLGTNRVVRCMPNIAATVGRALVGVTIPKGTDEAFRTLALTIIQAIGTPVEVPEEMIAAITGISGSGIAFVLAFLHAMSLGGTKAGLPYPTAQRAALAVLRGACELVESTGEHPISLLSKVASPAGTTIAGLSVFEERGVTSAVMEAVDAAARRAQELER